MKGDLFKWRLFFLTTIFLVSFTIFSSSGYAATYYVNASSGNDSNVGTSRDAPLKTIQKAADKLAPGDKCIVLPGSYSERVLITRPGASGQPIVFQAEGSSVITKGFTITADYIQIIGFEITNTINHWKDGAGIHLQGKYGEIKSNYIYDVTQVGIQVWAPTGEYSNTSNCIVSNNRIVKAGLAGMEIYGQNHLIENNDISHTLQCTPNWTDCPMGAGADADGFRFFGSGHIFRKNYVHDINYGESGNTNPHIDCFQTWSDEYGKTAGTNCIFEQNHCVLRTAQGPNEQGHAFMLRDASYLTIRNNLLQVIGGIETGGGNNSYLTIVNNTLIGDISIDKAWWPVGINMEGATNSIIKNNIIYNFPSESIFKGNSTGLDMDYNCAYKTDGTTPSGTPQSHDLWGVDPKFVNASSGDFNLRSDSPCIDVGVTLSQVANDFNGNSRPQGKGYDRGAFEFSSSAPSPPKGLKVVQ